MNTPYKHKSPEWREGRHNHLLREDIRYIAKHGGGDVEFLKPYCGDAKQMRAFLEGIGFKIRRTFIAELPHPWLETTGGISVHTGSGFVYSLAGKEKKS